MKMAARLREIVTTLRIETQGSRPRMMETEAFLSENEPDPAFRAELIAYMTEHGERTKRFDPSFRVDFVDGVRRRVTVSRSNPTKYANESVVDKVGVVDVRIDGQWVGGYEPLDVDEMLAAINNDADDPINNQI
jgi:hypothetical protein